MRAVLNGRTGTWHLVGGRGCGIDPGGAAYGDVIEANWATIRDRVERDAGDRCRNCRWPPV